MNHQAQALAHGLYVVTGGFTARARAQENLSRDNYNRARSNTVSLLAGGPLDAPEYLATGGSADYSLTRRTASFTARPGVFAG